MTGVMKGLWSCREGTAAIEFAIAMIPLSILLAGGITYAGVFAMQLSLSQAANEGARAAIAGASKCEREALAAAAVQKYLSLGNTAAAVVDVAVTDDEISVKIVYDYSQHAVTPILLPVPDSLMAEAMTLTDAPIISTSSC